MLSAVGGAGGAEQNGGGVGASGDTGASGKIIRIDLAAGTVTVS